MDNRTLNVHCVIRSCGLHPLHGQQRLAWATALQQQLHALDPILSLDLRGDPYAHFLSVLQGAFTMKNSVAGLLHIEDDAILCDDFVTRMRIEVARNPEEIIQFFSKFPDDANRTSYWHRRFVGGVCCYFPRHLIRIIHRQVADWDRRTLNPTAWDVAIGHWLRKIEMSYWLVLPNLADHRVGPSIIDDSRPQDRRSNSFISTTSHEIIHPDSHHSRT